MSEPYPALASRLPPATPALLAAAVGALFLAALAAWSAATDVDMVVTVPVIARPVTGTMELRAPLSGRVDRAALAEGAVAAAGQLVVALDAVLAREQLQAAQESLGNRRQQLAQQRAVMRLLDDRVPATTVPESARLQVEAQRRRVARLDDEMRAVESELRSIRRRTGTSRDLLRTERERYRAVEQALNAGALSRFEWLRARQALDHQAAETAALEGQTDVLASRLAALRHARAAQDADFRQSLLAAIATLELEVSQLAARYADAVEQMRLTRVVAPRAGLVDRLLVKPGDFVERGEVLAVVVPAGGAVYFEARVAPRQTAFLQSGQRCRIKLDALPFARYGALACTLQSLSHDVVRDDDGGHYVARIRPATQQLDAGTVTLSLQPGATGWVDIVCGRRSVLGFFTEPLRRFADESLREL